ncbi:MAG: 6-pyruvoyl-tetrahydropterin synthase-related protein [Actinomycetota bacterium]|nr:6-pyruvoyl-tetrahydropterin synthase-related protein [Actinomycetota bacterium]
MRRPSPTTVVSLLVVGGATLFVLAQLQPGLLLTDTTPAGGDMGAHVWGPAYLRDHLLPHGRITGWAPDWYAGFPWLTFYFPLPSLLIVLVDLVLPYGVAFKLVSVLGIVTLPVAAWAFGRLSSMAWPGPACLAVGTVPFLFDRSFTIYGGNIPSTLAGEFSFSLSLSLALVFLGLVARGLETGRHRALAAVVLAVTALSHVIPTFFAVAGAAVLTAFRLDRRRLRYVLGVGGVAGLLAAFWVIPFLFRLPYTNDMGWEKIVTYRKELFPHDLRWLVLLAGTGAVLSLVRRSATGRFLTVMAAVSAAGFVLAPQGRLWNARLLPFWFLCLYLLAAVAVAEVGRTLEDVAARRPRRRPAPASPLGADVGPAPPTGAVPGPAVLFTPVAALAATLVLVATPLHVLPAWAQVETSDQSFVPSWARWNYSGYERKPAYPEYRHLVDTMAALGRSRGCGRAMWEYEPELDRHGTPMALMLLPYWTDGCIGSMEGLFFESSATTPYHFLNQAELSLRPSSAQRDLPYRSLDVASGVEHLKLLGVRYYLALTPEAQAQARGRPDLRPVARSGPWSVNYPDGTKQRTWEVYEVEGSELVAPLAREPVVVKGVAKGGEEWLSLAVDWYQDPARWSIPLATDGPDEWARVTEPPAAGEPGRAVRPAKVDHIRAGDDRISFDVDRPGSPVLVKASYFPNWRASGAEGPWRVTPNLMVVVPTARHVELHYGFTPVDGLAWALTALGLVGLVVLARGGRVLNRQRGRSDEGPAEPGDPLDAELVSVLEEERALEIVPDERR